MRNTTSLYITAALLLAQLVLPIGLDHAAAAQAPRVTFTYGSQPAGINSVALADVNGDGTKDFVLGGVLDPNTGNGGTYVIFNSSNMPAVIDLQNLSGYGFAVVDSTPSVFGPTQNVVGTKVSNAGDINGDGKDDLLVTDSQTTGSNTQPTYMIWGKDDTDTVDLASFAASQGVEFSETNPITGTVSINPVNVGDINGDGHTDLAFGDKALPVGPVNGTDGQVHVVYGRATWPAQIDLNNLSAGEGFQISGNHNSETGWAVIGAGDINDDGIADIALSAPQDVITPNPTDPIHGNPTYTSAVYVIFGESNPTDLTLSSLGGRGYRMYSNANLIQGYDSLVKLGDINDDQHGDIAIATVGTRNSGYPTTNKVWTVFGKSSTSSIDLDSLGSQGSIIGFPATSAPTIGGDSSTLFAAQSDASGPSGEVNAGNVYGIPTADLTSSLTIPNPGVGYRVQNTTPNSYLGGRIANGSANGEMLVSSPDSASGVVAVVVPKQDIVISLPSPDITPPSLGTPNWSQNPITQGQSATLTVPATDSVSGVAGGEYFIGNTDPGVGNGSPMAYGGANITATLGSNLAAATYSIKVRAVDVAGNWSNTSTTQLVVNTPGAAPVFTSAASATAGTGAPFNYTVTTTGSPAPVLTRTGALPTGLSFNDNGDGTASISGSVAGAAGTYSLTITATNSAGSVQQNFTLNVNPVTITSPSTDTESFGVPFSFSVTTTGSPAPTITKTGGLPSGVTFKNNGNGTATISGTPSGTAAGPYTLNIKAKNNLGTANQIFVLQITKSPAIKNIATKTTQVGTAFSMNVTATGSPVPTLSVSGLPNGLSFTDNGNGVGTIAGTPSVGSGGLYTATVTATNSFGTSTLAFTIKVKEGPVITSDASASATVGSAFSFQITATGYPAPTFIKSGALPTGVTFHGSTGIISGTPKAGKAGIYPITITARNSSGTATQSFTLTVSDSSPL